jgi:hypothetical protein
MSETYEFELKGLNCNSISGKNGSLALKSVPCWDDWCTFHSPHNAMSMCCQMSPSLKVGVFIALTRILGVFWLYLDRISICNEDTLFQNT